MWTLCIQIWIFISIDWRNILILSSVVYKNTFNVLSTLLLLTHHPVILVMRQFYYSAYVSIPCSKRNKFNVFGYFLLYLSRRLHSKDTCCYHVSTVAKVIPYRDTFFSFLPAFDCAFFITRSEIRTVPHIPWQNVGFLRERTRNYDHAFISSTIPSTTYVFVLSLAPRTQSQRKGVLWHFFYQFC